MVRRRGFLTLLLGGAVWLGRSASAAPLAEASSAVRALLIDTIAASDTATRGRLIAEAESRARAMLTQAPGDIPARLLLALAIGLKARRAKPLEAFRAGWAQEGKALIEAAARDAPDHPWAQALLGGWHLEVLRRGGPAGGAMLGARESFGLAAFGRARALAPHDGAIALHFAAALLGYAPQRFAKQAAGLLDAALATAPDAADFAPPIRAAATAIRQTLADKGPAAAKAYVDGLA
jgi:hypothetical protein